jgi:hypothetical protein
VPKKRLPKKRLQLYARLDTNPETGRLTITPEELAAANGARLRVEYRKVFGKSPDDSLYPSSPADEPLLRELQYQDALVHAIFRKKREQKKLGRPGGAKDKTPRARKTESEIAPESRYKRTWRANKARTDK